MTAGLSATGLVIATQAELLAEIKAAMFASADLNPNGRINLGEDSVLGVLAAIMSDKLAELWQVLQEVHTAQSRAGAEGASLDSLAELVGSTRLAAAGSTATVTGTGTNGTVITAGSRVGDPDRTGVSWVVLAPVTIALGVYSASVQCDTTGPIAANAGSLTSIVTPISGWTTVTNPADADLGRNVQSDAGLRQAMIDALFAVGSGTTSAILSGVLAVAGTTSGKVYENNTPDTNAFGVPPHCVEVVVEGTFTDEDMAQAIYDNKPAGIGTYSASADGDWATDANGEDVDIAWSRPTAVPIYVYLQIELNSSNTTAQDEIKAAVVAVGDNLTTGQKVVRTKLFAPAYGVTGVVNVTRLGVSSVSAGAAITNATSMVDVTMAFRERPTFDTARVAIVLV